MTCNLGRRVLAEKVSKLLLLVVIIRRVTGTGWVFSVILQSHSMRQNFALLHLNGAWAALEPVRNENLVLLVSVAKGKNIGALESLIEVAKDVVDHDNGLLGVYGASDIYPC